MKVYTPKTLLTGYKIGLGTADTYIAIPKKYFLKTGKVLVVFGGKTRIVSRMDIEKEYEYRDKFDPYKTFKLAYVRWKNEKV